MEAANQDQHKVPWITNLNALGESTTEFKGDFHNSALDFGWSKLSDVTKMKKRAIQLNNGHATQMSILGLMVHKKPGNVDPSPHLSLLISLEHVPETKCLEDLGPLTYIMYN